MAVLEIKNLSVRYTVKEKKILACDGVELSVEERDSMGIVGESGSGKSTLAMGMLGLLPKPTTQVEGEIQFRGLNLVGLPDAEYAKSDGESFRRSFRSR